MNAIVVAVNFHHGHAERVRGNGESFCVRRLPM